MIVRHADGAPKTAGALELGGALSAFRSALIGVAAMSGLINVLYLTGSFFMLEVYDRVIPSRSVPTLLGLLALALVLYAFQGALESLRSRILSRVGAGLDEALSPRIFQLVVRSPLKGMTLGDGLLPLRDLDALRSFLSGSGPAAFFDLPWLPIYVGVCFLFHPLIGFSALFGAAFLAALTIATDLSTRRPSQMSTGHQMLRNGLADAGKRNAEVLAAMGMQDRVGERWARANRDYISAQQKVSDVASSFGSGSKIFRMALQSGVLAIGAWLVINNLASGGVIIASSILVSRALAPAELAIANWKGFVQARQSWKRLSDMLARIPLDEPQHALPAPRRTLSVETVSVAPPASSRVVVHDISLNLTAGQGLGIIGPSASGKSSLIRTLVGVWPTMRGKVRLDGAALDQWSSASLGPHVGFLPQEVELFAGTIADNIARSNANADPAGITEAAQAAGVHELILRLPEGYETKIGEGGAGLSAGQRQRVGLARALYGNPFLVVLDEPNSNLDNEGEHALTQAILGVRRRGGICIVVAHRPSALAAVDLILMMVDGRAQAFGSKEDILKRVLHPVANTESASGPSSSAGKFAREAHGAVT